MTVFDGRRLTQAVMGLPVRPARTGEFSDKRGRLLLKWNRYDQPLVGGGDSRRMVQLEEEVDLLRGQVAELVERVDFHERLLSQRREPGRVGRGE